MTERLPLAERVAFLPVGPDDFEELLALRIEAMRESLERLGRFSPERARERLQKSFYPEHSEHVLLDGERVGFHTFRPADHAFHLEHLYLRPRCQSMGIGSFVLKRLLAKADEAQAVVYVGALRESASNRFYQRHGFLQTGQGEWDVHYARLPQSGKR